jgi:DNA-binding response OmpR family regulator
MMANILCIDDDANGMAIRAEVLETEGHRVWQAPSPSKGLRLLQTERIDLVIIDYYLADANGLTLAREIKRLNTAMPIIVLSGFGELPGEALGVANDWVLKGSGPKAILLAVRKLVAHINP